jgi:tyrosyl-tRNA synthetase
MRAQEATAAVFGGEVAELSAAALDLLATALPTTSISRAQLGAEANLFPLLAEAGVTASNSEAHRLVEQNGISLNDVRVGADHVVESQGLLHGRYLMVRKGKKHLSLIVFDRP